MLNEFRTCTTGKGSIGESSTFQTLLCLAGSLSQTSMGKNADYVGLTACEHRITIAESKNSGQLYRCNRAAGAFAGAHLASAAVFTGFPAQSGSICHLCLSM